MKTILLALVSTVLIMSTAFNPAISAAELNEAICFTIANGEDTILVGNEELVEMGGLELSPDGTDNSSAFRVISFTVSTVIGAYEESYPQTNGARFTQQQIDLIRRAKPRKKIYIEDIKAVGPEGSVRHLGTLVFKIKG